MGEGKDEMRRGEERGGEGKRGGRGRRGRVIMT